MISWVYISAALSARKGAGLLFAVGIALATFGACGKSDFSGSSKVKPSGGNAIVGSPTPGGLPAAPETGSVDTSEAASIANLDEAFANFYFSGNGPGSCANNPSCGLGAPRCETGSEVVDTGYVGDCTNSPISRCYGNRLICRSKGKIEGDRVATDFMFFQDKGCPAGWEGAGPVAGQDHHKVGYLFGRQWGYYTFCRKTIPLSQIEKNRTSLVTDIKLISAGRHVDQPANCPNGYQPAGVILDCVNSPTNLLPGGVTCKGFVRACKQFKTAL